MDDQSVSLIKAFHYVVTPLGGTLLLFALAMLMLAFNKHKLKAFIIYFAVFFLWFCATPITSNWLLKQYNSLSNVTDQCFDKTCDYEAIVVAGYMKPYKIGDPRLNQFWSERLWHAKAFYKHNIPIIVISSQYPTPPTPSQGELSYAKQTLLNWGIKHDDIIMTKPARTTREAMLNAYSELEKIKPDNVLLIGYKLRITRKLLSIEKINQQKESKIIFTPTFAKHSISEATLSPLVLKSWLPSEDYLLASRHTLHEFAALIAYKVSNWI